MPNLMLISDTKRSHENQTITLNSPRTQLTARTQEDVLQDCYNYATRMPH